MAGVTGLEPAASGVTGQQQIQAFPTLSNKSASNPTQGNPTAPEELLEKITTSFFNDNLKETPRPLVRRHSSSLTLLPKERCIEPVLIVN
jgi:hypothetical protein